MIPPFSQVLLADNSPSSDMKKEEIGRKLQSLHQKCAEFRVENQDLSFLEPDVLHEYAQIPLERISAAENTDGKVASHITVVFGGETHGLSEMSVKLAHEFRGAKIFVDLKNNMDSLNVACAASVILFNLSRKIA